MAKTGEIKTLIIVESKNKTETIKQFLPSNYTVMASNGHIVKIKDSGIYNMGIDPTNQFTADFVVDPDKKDTVKRLNEAVKLYDKVVIASDPDNEGEAIAHHLKNILKIPESKYERVTFHEITKKVVLDGLANPRKIDENLATSAITRAKLDKIVGYRLSPICMTKCSCRSAGRVQSAALKILVTREEEIINFIPKQYYEIWLPFTKDGTEYRAQYKGTDEKKMVSISDKAVAQAIINSCKGNNYLYKKSESKDRSIPSKEPFKTSTFKQEASNKLGLSPNRSMECAQHLFEGIELGGQHVALITYMRTDSTTMNPEFASALAEHVKTNYGENYYVPVRVGKKSANAQEGHECLRCVDLSMTPSKLSSLIDDQMLIKVYTLIYRRTVASAMADAIITDTEYSIYNQKNRFAFSTHEVKFDGFRKVYNYTEEDEEAMSNSINFKAGEVIDAKELELVEKETKPSKRYTEAGLVSKLEEVGIGRPSTYASTIKVLLDAARGYCEKDGKTIKPTNKGIVLSHFLDKAFGDIINLTYTAEMEAELDKIAVGQLNDVTFLTDFYNKLDGEISTARGITSERPAPVDTGEVCPKCGHKLVYRQGRYGRFKACSNFPRCKYTANEKAVSETVENKTEVKPATVLLKYNCPKCGKPLVKRVNSKTGSIFYSCSGYPACKNCISEEQFIKLVEKQDTNRLSIDRD